DAKHKFLRQLQSAHRLVAGRLARECKAHRVIDIRTASRISFESARSSTARARIIPPTRLAYAAIAFSRFACFERPGMRLVRNSNVDRSDSVIAFRTGAP